MSTALDSKNDTRVAPKVQEPGDHDLFAHYVRKAQITQAAIEGTPAEGLCGKKWIPTRDGQKFPVCPECKELFEDNQHMGGLPGSGNPQK